MKFSCCHWVHWILQLIPKCGSQGNLRTAFKVPELTALIFRVLFFLELGGHCP